MQRMRNYVSPTRDSRRPHSTKKTFQKIIWRTWMGKQGQYLWWLWQFGELSQSSMALSRKTKRETLNEANLRWNKKNSRWKKKKTADETGQKRPCQVNVHCKLIRNKLKADLNKYRHKTLLSAVKKKQSLRTCWSSTAQQRSQMSSLKNSNGSIVRTRTGIERECEEFDTNQLLHLTLLAFRHPRCVC